MCNHGNQLVIFLCFIKRPVWRTWYIVYIAEGHHTTATNQGYSRQHDGGFYTCWAPSSQLSEEHRTKNKSKCPKQEVLKQEKKAYVLLLVFFSTDTLSVPPLSLSLSLSKCSTKAHFAYIAQQLHFKLNLIASDKSLSLTFSPLHIVQIFIADKKYSLYTKHTSNIFIFFVVVDAQVHWYDCCDVWICPKIKISFVVVHETQPTHILMCNTTKPAQHVAGWTLSSLRITKHARERPCWQDDVITMAG